MGGGASKASKADDGGGSSGNDGQQWLGVTPSSPASPSTAAAAVVPAAPTSPARTALQLDGLVGTHKTATRIEELRQRVEFDESGAEMIGFPPAELFVAAGRGELGELQRLLKAATAELTDGVHWKSGATAMHVAALQGHDECVAALLEQGADRTVTDLNGLTPLHYAALCPSAECIAVLLSGDTREYENRQGHRAPLSHHVSDGDETPLLLAVGAVTMGWTGFDAVQALIDDGCPLDLPDCCGATPLHLAANGDEEECALALLKAGAPTVLTDAGGMLPLQLATTPRMSSLLRGEPVAGLENAWTREDDASLDSEGQSIEEAAKEDESRADWSLADVTEVFVSPEGEPVFIGRALYSHNAMQEDDLQFDKGDEIAVIAEDVSARLTRPRC
jgi:hypothetical protein